MCFFSESFHGRVLHISMGGGSCFSDGRGFIFNWRVHHGEGAGGWKNHRMGSTLHDPPPTPTMGNPADSDKTFPDESYIGDRLSWKFQHNLIICSKVMTFQSWHSMLKINKKQVGEAAWVHFWVLMTFLYLTQSSEICTVYVPEGL